MAARQSKISYIFTGILIGVILSLAFEVLALAQGHIELFLVATSGLAYTFLPSSIFVGTGALMGYLLWLLTKSKRG